MFVFLFRRLLALDVLEVGPAKGCLGQQGHWRATVWQILSGTEAAWRRVRRAVRLASAAMFLNMGKSNVTQGNQALRLWSTGREP